MAVRKEITPKQIARLKLRYANRTIPVHDIAREEGVTPSQIYELRRRFGWPTRTELGERSVAKSIEDERAISRALAQAGAATALGGKAAEAATPPEDIRDIVDVVTKALEKEIAAAERKAAASSEAGAAARAKMLSSFVRTLATLRNVKPGAAAAPPPLDADELKKTLREKLGALRAQADED
ncbi:MAG: hypothetical protein KGM42_10610 [Hyphomicrobiales bacterium]|nr:hypothetical protein [Hyphomicrobiales bacterium]